MASTSSPTLTQRLSGLLPRISIMDRYIARELTLPFLFGVGAFSSIAVSIGALRRCDAGGAHGGRDGGAADRASSAGDLFCGLRRDLGAACSNA